jgi:hypothetical protein
MVAREQVWPGYCWNRARLRTIIKKGVHGFILGLSSPAAMARKSGTFAYRLKNDKGEENHARYDY